MPTLLTKRKQKWVQQRKPNVVRGAPLTPNLVTADRYGKALVALIDKMTAETERELMRFFKGKAAKDFFTEDASPTAQARILTNALIRKFEALFAKKAKPLAEKMADAVDANSSSSMHGSLQQLSGGLSLPTSALTTGDVQVLNAAIMENVALIKSIPQQYLSGVQQAVARSITSGNGLQDLVPYLKKHKGITQRRAKMIALDQTRKAFNNMNKGRMERIGIKKFEWLHTGGSNEPRKLHQQMNGKIYEMDNLPIIDQNTGERGIPGQLINCRCRMIPVLDFGGDDGQ